MLFDDAFSEIDAARRHRLLEKAMRYEQVLITTTDLDQVKHYLGTRSAYFHVFGGQVWKSDEHGNAESIPVFGEDTEGDEDPTVDESL